MSFSFLAPNPGSWPDRLITFIIANLFWLFCAVFVFPLPAATAGLFATFLPWIRGRDKEIFATFFGAMRRLWLKSTLIALADVAVVALLVLNFQVLSTMDQQSIIVWVVRSVQVFIVLSLLMTNIYVWPLLVLFDLPLRRLISVSIRMGLAHPLWSFLIVVLTTLPLLSSLVLPGVVVMLSFGSTTALIVSWGAWRIIRLHATPEELALLDER